MKKYLIIPFITIVIISSCSKEKADNNAGSEEVSSETKLNEDSENNGEKPSGAGFKESGVEFNVEYDEPRRIYKILKDDMNGDGNNEIIILSIAREDEFSNYDYYNFDMVEIFELDESDKSYKKILSDTVDYSKECIIESLDGDSSKQMMIKTYTGGNNIIASSGMFVYGMTFPQHVEQLKYFDSGDPQLNDVNEDNKKEILVSDAYTAVMPHVNIIPYVKDIYSFDKNKLVRSNSRFGDFYDKKIKESMSRYKEYKDKLIMGMDARDYSYPVYSEAIDIILNYQSKGDAANMTKFWNEEKDFLQKHISYDEYIDLKSLVTKQQPVVENF